LVWLGSQDRELQSEVHETEKFSFNLPDLAKNSCSKIAQHSVLKLLFERVTAWIRSGFLNKVCCTKHNLQLSFRVKPHHSNKSQTFSLVKTASEKSW
jgi:hypothetical protein